MGDRPPRTDPPLRHDPIEITWTALRAGGPASTRVARFVLSLQVMGDDHAILEAWTEIPGVAARTPIRERAPVRCEVVSDSYGLHIDAFESGDERCLVAVSLDQSGAVRFASSTLLPDAGWSRGQCDPPHGGVTTPATARQDAG